MTTAPSSGTDATRPVGDVLLVNWDSPNDPECPKKCVFPLTRVQQANYHVYSWTYRKKWAATLTVSSFTFISPVSSSMVAPASRQIAQQFGITSTVLIAMTVSVFVLGYGVLSLSLVE